MAWVPTRFWEGRNVYIIGGGHSLRDFDFTLLNDVPAIGCNDAFLKGARICNINVFCDLKWWNEYNARLEDYQGLVVTNCQRFKNIDAPGVFLMDKVNLGLGTDKLAYNGNTGAAASNLALILGAARVYLIGFDMKLDKDGEANWHKERIEYASPEVYPRFITGFDFFAKELEAKFPGTEIINLTEDSELNVFPKESIIKHFGLEADNG